MRVRWREDVITSDHLVPSREELAEVVVVISIDTVSEQNDRAVLHELDKGRNCPFDSGSTEKSHVVDGVAVVRC